MNKLPYTLITGASTGLGRALAVQCARRKMNIILIALPGSNTQYVADSLNRAYNIDVQVFEFDMTDIHALTENFSYIAAHYNVSFLINNAGIGGTSSILETSAETIDRIIQLNVRSTAMVTRYMIPCLLNNKRSYIMNISSMAAFTPIAYKTVYPASKAFISSFSLGLREELAELGVQVSVVYPGPIMTNCNTTRRIIKQGIKGKIGLLSTDKIAAQALAKTLKGQPVIIPGLQNRVNHILMNLLPMGLKLQIVSKAVKKEMQLQF